MFSRLESHHDPTCSIHQTLSDIQVLCQHHLEMIKTPIAVIRHIRSRGDLKTTSKIGYLSSHFELDDSAHGAVGIDSLDESRVAVQSLKHMD